MANKLELTVKELKMFKEIVEWSSNIGGYVPKIHMSEDHLKLLERLGIWYYVGSGTYGDCYRILFYEYFRKNKV